jgi:hypothetical protein
MLDHRHACNARLLVALDIICSDALFFDYQDFL